MLSLSDMFDDLLRHEAPHLVLASIPPDRQDEPVGEAVVEAEEHYIRVWLAEMYLCDDRRLFRQFVPVVHSVIRLRFADRPMQELPYVAGPQALRLGDRDTLGKGIQLNHPLTNLVPFRGGTVSLSVGLFAYQAMDFFQEFSQVLQKVTGLLNAGQLSATLKVVDTAVDGIQTLLGAGDKDIHLLYYQTGGPVPLRSGYVAIVNADEATFDKDRLFVRESRLYYGDSQIGAKPLTGYDYMLLCIEAPKKRDDYRGFDNMSKLLDEAIIRGQTDRAAGETILSLAKAAAWASPDLTRTDRVRVAAGMQEDFDERVPPAEPSGPRDLAEVETSLSERAQAIGDEDAASKAASISRAGGSLDHFLGATR